MKVFKKAEKALNKSLTKDPSNMTYVSLLSVLYNHAKKREEAIKCLEYMESIEEYRIPSLSNKVVVYTTQGKYLEAKRICLEIIDAWEDTMWFFIERLWKIEKELWNYEKAVDILRQLHIENPLSPVVIIGLLEIYRDTKDYEEIKDLCLFSRVNMNKILSEMHIIDIDKFEWRIEHFYKRARHNEKEDTEPTWHVLRDTGGETSDMWDMLLRD